MEQDLTEQPMVDLVDLVVVENVQVSVGLEYQGKVMPVVKVLLDV